MPAKVMAAGLTPRGRSQAILTRKQVPWRLYVSLVSTNLGSVLTFEDRKLLLGDSCTLPSVTTMSRHFPSQLCCGGEPK